MIAERLLIIHDDAGMSALDSTSGRAGGSPLADFTGAITRTKLSPLYVLGLGVVAFAMVLLPAIYLGLILLAVWGVLFHLTHHLGILTASSGGGLGKMLAYLGPAVAGGILVFFMLKPLFARRPKESQPLFLDPAQEPLLFAFVQRICQLVGAPMPGRIDVDCQVNASASLRRGLLSRDLVLTIGLPLAAGLNLRQFISQRGYLDPRRAGNCRESLFHRLLRPRSSGRKRNYSDAARGQCGSRGQHGRAVCKRNHRRGTGGATRLELPPGGHGHRT